MNSLSNFMVMHFGVHYKTNHTIYLMCMRQNHVFCSRLEIHINIYSHNNYCLFVHSFLYSFISLFIYLSIHVFLYSDICSFIYSFFNNFFYSSSNNLKSVLSRAQPSIHFFVNFAIFKVLYHLN